MTRDRQAGIAFLLVALGGLLSAYLRWVNPVDFLPSDPRSAPGYNDAVIQFMVLLATISFVVGIVLLYRSRTRRD